MTDYKRLLDSQTRAFIDSMNAFYPPDALALSITDNREIYGRMSRSFHSGHPPGVRAETGQIAAAKHAIPIRSYRRECPDPAAVLLYFHGGGFILGDLDSHDDICAELCSETGYETVSVGYRLAPEFVGTAALEDCAASLAWACSAYHRPIVLVGESAGGNLAASLSYLCRDKPVSPRAQILIYPALGGNTKLGTYVTHANAPLLTTSDVEYYAGVRAERPDFRDDPRFSPLAANDYARLPPTAIFTAECDPLCSDGETYRDRLVAAGCSARLYEGPGLPHGYLRGRHQIDRAGNCFRQIVDEAKRLVSAISNI